MISAPSAAAIARDSSVLPLSAITISPRTEELSRNCRALRMQMPTASASFRQGITIEISMSSSAEWTGATAEASISETAEVSIMGTPIAAKLSHPQPPKASRRDSRRDWREHIARASRKRQAPAGPLVIDLTPCLSRRRDVMEGCKIPPAVHELAHQHMGKVGMPADGCEQRLDLGQRLLTPDGRHLVDRRDEVFRIEPRGFRERCPFQRQVEETEQERHEDRDIDHARVGVGVGERRVTEVDGVGLKQALAPPMGSLVEPFRGPVLEIGKADESETELAQVLVEIGKIRRPIIERKKVRLGDEADRPLLEGTSAAANDLQFRTLGVELDDLSRARGRLRAENDGIEGLGRNRQDFGQVEAAEIVALFRMLGDAVDRGIVGARIDIELERAEIAAERRGLDRKGGPIFAAALVGDPRRFLRIGLEGERGKKRRADREFLRNAPTRADVDETDRVGRKPAGKLRCEKATFAQCRSGQFICRHDRNRSLDY